MDSVIHYFRNVGSLRDYTVELQQASAKESIPAFCSLLADIYRVKLTDNTQVAVKSLRCLSSGPDKVLKRSARELEYWRNPKDDRVLELRGFALFRGKISMISPWMVNGNVIQYLEGNSSVDRYQICVELIDVVVWLHDKHVIHGDLRGANILVSEKGRLKLADFGLTILNQPYLEFSKTDPGGGTLLWMAPELLSEEGARCKETDMYALAMTMLASDSREIITGKPPFEGVSFTNVRSLVDIIEGKLRPKRPEGWLMGSPMGDGFWRLLEECWKHAPNERLTANQAQRRITHIGINPDH